MNLTIIGGGRAAWAFGSAWKRAGWLVECVALRPGSPSRLPELLSTRRATLDETWSSDLVLVAVPDDALPSVCSGIAKVVPGSTWLFHPSGSLDSTIFGDSEKAFSLHPLRALPPPGEGGGLEGALLVFEGCDAARNVATEIAEGLGARMASVAHERKPAYHAAAVIASNLVAAQLDVATDLMRDLGLEVPDIRNEIANLARSAIENWAGREGFARFTGPIARGDVELVRKHLAHLASHDEASSLYRVAGLALCRRILESRPGDERVRTIEALLSQPGLP